MLADLDVFCSLARVALSALGAPSGGQEGGGFRKTKGSALKAFKECESIGYMIYCICGIIFERFGFVCEL